MRLPRLLIDIAVCVLAASCSSPKEQGGGGSAASASAPAHAAPAAGSAAPAAPAPPPPPPKPTTTLEQVQQASPAGAHVAAAALRVSGVELFTVGDAKASDGGKLVGVVGGVGGKLLEDNELMRAVIEAKPPARVLAEVALAVAQQDAEIVDKPTSGEQRKARVRAPRAAGGSLVFWVSTRGTPRLFEKASLDLTSGALALVVPPSSHAAAVASAIGALTDPSVTIDPRALQLLAASCKEPRVQAALLRVMGTHPSAETRAAIIDSAPKCGAPAVGPLVDALEHDKSAMVRPHAATALGRIGDSRARPALAKAARGEDANVAWAASNALKKIP